MVKPAKTMEPESVDLAKAGRAAGKAFEEDSFRNYMARKIDLQRKQFGLELPPPPTPTSSVVKSTQSTHGSTDSKRKAQHVTFAAGVKEHDAMKKKKRHKSKSSKSPMSALVRRLKRKHGPGYKRPSSSSSGSRRQKKEKEEEPITIYQQEESSMSSSTTPSPSPSLSPPKPQPKKNSPEHAPTQYSDEEEEEEDLSPRKAAAIQLQRTAQLARERPDLFFLGVVVMVNGYTHPDVETIQRLLHKHGGDLEKYETTRITHIVAEHLSTAKANIYKRMRRPTPVVHPNWIVDCVKAGKRLPHGDYLIEEVKDKVNSMKYFFDVKQKDKNQSGKETSGDKSPPPTTNKDNLPNQKPSAAAVKLPPTTTDTIADIPPSKKQPTDTSPNGKTDDKFINGKIRTTGTDPNFLESFFHHSRLSFIGSYKQRIQESPIKNKSQSNHHDDNTQRFVFHADMDCFFAAVVLRNYPHYRNKPVAISHFGKTNLNPNDSAGSNNHQQPKKNSSSECATCNYEARKYGIKKGMFLGQAKQLCPNLIVLPYDFEGYEEVSEQVAVILQRYATDYEGQVEQVSCDESYLEFFFPVGDKDPRNDPYRLAGQVANQMRREILQVTRCTATIGVGANKFLAKLATDQVKPDGSFVVRNPSELLRNLKLQDLYGIGYRTNPKLLEEGLVSVQDVWDLGDHGERELCRILGQGLGKKIFEFCKGQDDRPVQEAERKTIGAECNYGVRFDGPYGVEYMIEGLAKEVQRRMEGVDTRGSQVTLKLKQRKQGAKQPPKFLGHGSCHNLSKSRAINNGATRDWATIAEIGKALFVELHVDKDDVRGMGIVVSKLDKAATTDSGGSGGKQSIKNWFSAAKSSDVQTAAVQKGQRVADQNDALGSPPLPMLAQEPDSEPTETTRAEHDETVAANLLVSMHNPSFSQIDESVLRELPTQIREELKGDEQRGAPSKAGEGKVSTSNHEDEMVVEATQQAQEEGDRDECDAGENMVQLKVLSDGSEDEEAAAENTNIPPSAQPEPYIDESDEEDGAAADETNAPHIAQPESDFGDVALPPLSQIRLSQVEALPSPLKKQINSKIAERKSSKKRQHQPKRARSYSSDNTNNPKRLRQVSVKRMFRLAEMKAGKATGEDFISVDDLKKLPLELQLQVANNDNRPLGDVSATKARKTASKKSGSSHARASTSTRRNDRRSASVEAESQSQVEGLETQPVMFEVEKVEAIDFFLDNLAPLSTFMDDNQDSSGEALDQVAKYLCLCVEENRMRDVFLLLRNIKNRSDSWGRIVYDQLFDAVDGACKEKRGYRLDREGMGL